MCVAVFFHFYIRESVREGFVVLKMDKKWTIIWECKEMSDIHIFSNLEKEQEFH